MADGDAKATDDIVLALSAAMPPESAALLPPAPTLEYDKWLPRYRMHFSFFSVSFSLTFFSFSSFSLPHLLPPHFPLPRLIQNGFKRSLTRSGVLLLAGLHYLALTLLLLPHLLLPHLLLPHLLLPHLLLPRHLTRSCASPCRPP